jgi:pimeloyl-ACP methyl ester carboxylesterase
MGNRKTQTIITSSKLVENLRIYYSTAGSSSNLHLVFFPCWAARLKGIDRIVSHLSKFFYVVTPELPGLLRSDPPQNAWTPADYAKSINKLLSTLSLKDPILLGYSFGGAIATEYPRLFPRNIRALVLIETVTTNHARGRFLDMLFDWGRYMDKKVLCSRVVPKTMKKLALNLAHGVPFDFLQSDKSLRYDHFLNKKINFIDVDYRKLLCPLVLFWSNSIFSRPSRKRAEEISSSVSNSELVIYEGNHLTFYFYPEHITRELAVRFSRSLFD